MRVSPVVGGCIAGFGGVPFEIGKKLFGYPNYRRAFDTLENMYVFISCTI